MSFYPNKAKSIYVLLVLAASCVGHFSYAQILNVEKSRIKQDSANYFVGKIGLNFTLHNRDEDETGTNLFIGLIANTNTAYLSAKNSYILINYINYTALGDKEASHTGYTHFRTNFSRQKKISTEAFTQYQYDLGRGLRTRWLAGAGVRVKLIENEENTFIFGPGLMYEFEDWVSPSEPQESRKVDLIKSSNYLSLNKKLTDQVNLNTIAYYQAGYDEAIGRFRHRVSGEVNIAINITKKLALATAFNCTFENKPIVPVNKFIYTVTNGVEYNF